MLQAVRPEVQVPMRSLNFFFNLPTTSGRTKPWGLLSTCWYPPYMNRLYRQGGINISNIKNSWQFYIRPCKIGGSYSSSPCSLVCRYLHLSVNILLWCSYWSVYIQDFLAHFVFCESSTFDFCLQVEKIVTIMSNPRQYKIPDWFLNRQKDIVDGKYSQVFNVYCIIK
jgi:hypothetical protein